MSPVSDLLVEHGFHAIDAISYFVRLVIAARAPRVVAVCSARRRERACPCSMAPVETRTGTPSSGRRVEDAHPPRAQAHAVGEG